MILLSKIIGQNYTNKLLKSKRNKLKSKKIKEKFNHGFNNSNAKSQNKITNLSSSRRIQKEAKVILNGFGKRKQTDPGYKVKEH